MRKYAFFGLITLACFSFGANPLELEGIRYAGYTTNTVQAGFSILAVPFSGYNTNSFSTNSISLEALVSTNGLAVNDRLIVFDEVSTNYYYYKFTGTSWTNLLVTDLLGGDSTNYVVNAPALSTRTNAQGYAFWLNVGGTRTVQLQGIVNTNAAGINIKANGFTLIGNSLPTPLDLNSWSFTNNTWFTAGPPGIGDEIHVVSGTNYLRNIYYSGSWQYAEQTATNTVLKPASIIPVGSGVWYLRRGVSKILTLK